MGKAAMGKTIMVVDDSRSDRRKICGLLEGVGYACLEAPDGLQAIRLYETQRPDAVLLDLAMPGTDGLQVLQEIQRIDRAAKVAMLSVYENESVREFALVRGARDWLSKGDTDGRVLECVQGMVGVPTAPRTR